MNFQQLRSIREAARRGYNLTEVANALFTSQPGVSRQIRELEEAGADIVRVSCPDVESTAALPAIVRASKVPIVADIHFHYKRGIEAAKAGADAPEAG